MADVMKQSGKTKVIAVFLLKAKRASFDSPEHPRHYAEHPKAVREPRVGGIWISKVPHPQLFDLAQALK
jgi:hypothetical protein